MFVCLEKVLKMAAEPEQVEETKEVMEVTETSSQEDSVSESKSRWVTWSKPLLSDDVIAFPRTSVLILATRLRPASVFLSTGVVE